MVSLPLPLGLERPVQAGVWTTSPSVPGRVVASVCRPHQLRVTMRRTVSVVAPLGFRLQTQPLVQSRPLSSVQVG